MKRIGVGQATLRGEGIMTGGSFQFWALGGEHDRLT
jgi:hypothetical protein